MTGQASMRFRRDGVEFELSGSAEDVRKAWTALEALVVAAYAEPARSSANSGTKRLGEGSTGETPGRRPRRKSTRGSTATGEAKPESNLSKLLAARVDEFPEIGDNPTALYAGYAVLRWAKETLGIDGLTATDIQEFLQQNLRIKNSSNAYRVAFANQPRAVDASGDRPAVFRLMRPGEKALDAYLNKVATGATAAEAQAAGDEAEQKA